MTEGRLYTATITMTVNFSGASEAGADHRARRKVTQLGKTIAFVEGQADGRGRHRARDRQRERAVGRGCEGHPLARLGPRRLA